jgi:hypothetical protein
MSRLVTNKFKIHIAEQLVESLSEIDPTNLYLFIGKTDEWDDETDPPFPTKSVANTQFRYWDQMMSAKKITPSDVKHVITRTDWSFGSDYFAYTHDSNVLYDNEFYVVTDDYNVYKCLQNNLSNGVSTIKPTGNGVNVIELTDGYKWKFMYSIKPQDVLKFTDDKYIPVPRVGIDTIIGKQKDVQDSAIDGALDVINKTSNGHFIVNLKNFPTNNSGEEQDFIVGEILYGQASNTFAELISYTSGNTKIIVNPTSEKFIKDETIRGLTSESFSTVFDEPLSTYEFTSGTLTSVQNSTAMFLSFSANNTSDGLYVNSTIFITNNAGQGEQSKIIRYDSQTRKIIVDSPFKVTPNTSSGYIITPTIEIKGDGSGAVGRTLGNSTHGITSTIVSERGRDYTYASTEIYANNITGSGATAKVIIGPVGGHGKNAIEELNAHRILIDVTLNGNEFNYFTVTNDYRQFGLLRDPISKEDGSFYSSSHANQTIKLKLLEMSGRFILDEKIYIGNSLNESTANGFLVDFTYRDEIRLNSTYGNFEEGLYITGEQSGATAKINYFYDKDLKPYSGDILYVENKQKVQRLSDQVENYKIILEF